MAYEYIKTKCNTVFRAFDKPFLIFILVKLELLFEKLILKSNLWL